MAVLIATIVMAVGTGLAAVAGLISALVALRTERRTRHLPISSTKRRCCSHARQADLAAALPRGSHVVIAQGYETLGEVVMLKGIRVGGGRVLVILPTLPLHPDDLDEPGDPRRHGGGDDPTRS
jgi:hypothetical protein